MVTFWLNQNMGMNYYIVGMTASVLKLIENNVFQFFKMWHNAACRFSSGMWPPLQYIYISVVIEIKTILEQMS